MDGQYGPPIPPYGAYNPYGQPQMIPPEAFQPRLHQLQTMSNDSLHSYHSDYDDPSRTMLPPRAPPRSNRRRQAQGAEHVKHRRTRSGCYTCRQRRVKCDETHPMCERCRKGKRECVWPEHSSSKSERGSSRSKRSSGEGSPSSNSEEESELAPIADEDEFDDEEESDIPSAISESKSRFATPGDGKTTPISEHPPTLSRPTRPTPTRTTSKQTVKDDITQNPKWPSLPPNVKFYLKYHRNHLSYHHYAWKYDGGDFLKKTFLEIAINSEPLLYAVVAFAAYHNALTKEGGKVKDFLDAYNRSLSALRQSLAKSERPNISTLLTILQLATIEEFLGDWVNLLSHQRAAYQIITDLFTPQTITQSETHRKIISWYIRFDLFAAAMSGGNPALGREWFASCADFYKRQSRDRPNEVGARFEEWFASSRLLATDTAILFASKTAGKITDENFMKEIGSLTNQMAAFENMLDNAFTDPSCFVKSFPNAPSQSDAEITDFRDPTFCYTGDLFTMNFVRLDFWAIVLMFKYQISMMQPNQAAPAELMELALTKCKILEAVQYSGQGPPGAVLGCQASLGIAALMLPKDDKHTNWCRSKFALMEQMGYIYPANLRKRMSDLWSSGGARVDVTHWWLDNEEGYNPVIRSLRDFIDFRALSAAREPDAKDADVRDMNGIFRTLNLETKDLPEHVAEMMKSEGWFEQSGIYESSPDQAY